MVYHSQLRIGDVPLNIWKFIFEMLLWNTVIGVIIILIAGGFLLKPVNKFLDIIHHLASGHYNVRLNFTGPVSHLPTVKEITDSINVLASELEQTEILRTDFINNFSHEFKTPIVSIAGFAKMLKRGDLSPEEQQEYLDIIEEESMRLAQMSTNVLNLTKVESQTILTDVSEFNLSEQIRTCVLVLEGKWTKKNIEMSLTEEDYHIKGNPDLLQLVWINLLDNAIKFSENYNPVEVRILQDSDKTTVEISNYCEDIPEEKQTKIFSKFYQGEESHGKEGNGVGLAIAKKVIELHNGSVYVTSKNGKTTFYTVIPR